MVCGEAKLAGRQPQGVLKTCGDSRGECPKTKQRPPRSFGTYFQNDWPESSGRFRFRSRGSVYVHPCATGLHAKLPSVLLPFSIKMPP